MSNQKRQTLDDMLGSQAPSEEELETPESAGAEAAAPRSSYDGSKKFGADEVLTPRLNLLQGQSPAVQAKEGSPGQFLALGHEAVDEVVLVVAGHTSKRRYAPDPAQPAECFSPDGIQGYGNPGIPCDSCPLSKWTDSGKKKPDGSPINVPPPCQDIDSFVCFSVTHGMPVTWDLKSTGARAARFIKTLSNGLGMGHFALEVTAEQKTKPGRSWYEPKLVLAKDLSLEECQVYAQLALGAVKVAGALPETTADPDS